jgi:transcriptional regulator with XRE-family HTH domain
MLTAAERVPLVLIDYVNDRMRLLRHNPSSLSKAAGLSRQAIYNLVEGKKMPKPETLLLIAPHLGTTTDTLNKLAGYTDGPMRLIDRLQSLCERANMVLARASPTEVQVTIEMLDGMISRLESSARSKSASARK